MSARRATASFGNSTSTWLRAAVVVVAILACGRAASAQAPEGDTAPPAGEFEPAPLPPGNFLVPDAPSGAADKTAVKAKWFTLKIGFVAIADYNAFGQDATSLAQVGRQDNQWDDRAARLLIRGSLGKASYLVAGEYKGFDLDPDTTWQMTDVSLTVPIGGPSTKLTIGKTKETFTYEMVGDAANLPAQERVLSPFFVSRNVGVKVTRVLGEKHRMTLSGGVYNDWWVQGDDFDDSGTSVTGRVTGLAWDAPDGRYLHLGIAGRYAGADNDTMRFRARPESNVTDDFLDTGPLQGNGSRHLGFEGLLGEGPFSVLGEYSYAWVDSPASGDPQFFGYYLAASWVLTGESRPYDRTVGYARRVMPTHRWGAPEIVARFSHVDLDDGVVEGGTFDKTYLGLNWWATRRWKFGLGWGRTWLDRFDSRGTTDALHARFQWVY